MFWEPGGNKGLPPIWNIIFKDDSTWLREMEELRCIKPTALPTLVGWGLHDVMEVRKQVYLVLLVHDWSGELKYSQGALMESLKSFKHVGKEEVHILGTNITLNISECIGCCSRSGYISMEDPRRIFRRRRGPPRTSILYYGDDTVYDVPPSYIGGIEVHSRGKRRIENICSIRMKLGDDRPVYRVFVRDKMNLRLRNIVTKDDFGRQWVTNWKEIRSGWRE